MSPDKYVRLVNSFIKPGYVPRVSLGRGKAVLRGKLNNSIHVRLAKDDKCMFHVAKVQQALTLRRELRRDVHLRVVVR